jgi:chorismate mutase
MLQLGEIRVRLDQMTDRIVSRLKDRSRFPLNPAVYHVDGVPIRGRSGISFLQFALEGLEAYHASLGRYDFPDEAPLFAPPTPSATATRTITRPPVARLRINRRDHLLAFYAEILGRLCPPGDDTNTYGETVYVDSDLLELINERINVGRYVAQVKADREPAVLELVDQPSRLEAALRDPAREETLVRTARGIAARYEVDPDLVEDVFRWIIAETMLVEMAYLQQVATDEA